MKQEEIKVKIICSRHPERVDQQAEEFCKNHNVTDIKQTNASLMIIFYTDKMPLYTKDIVQEIKMDL